MSNFRNFHWGEAKLQAESGIDTQAFDDAVHESFKPELNDSEVRFVGERTFSIGATTDAQGRPWASPLFGEAGRLFEVEDRITVRVRPRLIDGDPLFDNVRSVGSFGVLFFNPAIRRRAKSLGRAVVEPDGSITYRLSRMFGLCPKYIFKRDHAIDGEPESGDVGAERSSVLSMADREQLQKADTIFLSSHSEIYGSDPTHRGGPPGFVTVEDDATLSMPDYIGNGMFQTLGNLQLDDRVSVLSVDFSSGRIVQLTGRGSVDVAQPGGVRTSRSLRVAIEEVRSTIADIGIWTDIEPFVIPV